MWNVSECGDDSNLAHRGNLRYDGLFKAQGKNTLYSADKLIGIITIVSRA